MPANEQVDRRERLMSLILALLHTEHPLTAEQLWERIPGYAGIVNQPSFRQAFERDKKELRRHSVPLVIETVYPTGTPVDGYRIDRKRYYLNMPPMDADELSALRLATTLFRVGDTSADEGLFRLGGLEPTAVDPDGTVPLATVDTVNGLDELFTAMAARSTVHFSYRGIGRSVDPLRIELHGGRWYLAGHDHGHDEMRRYRVDRLESSVTVDPPGSFTRDPDQVVSGLDPPWLYPVDDEVTARIAVDAGHADWAIQQAGGWAEVERRDDGSVVLSMKATNHDALRWFVLELLDHGELLEPPELRQELITWLEKLA